MLMLLLLLLSAALVWAENKPYFKKERRGWDCGMLPGVVDVPGNVLIADTSNNRIVEVVPMGPNWNDPDAWYSWESCAVSFCGGEGAPFQIGVDINVGLCNYSRTDNVYRPYTAQRIGCGLTLTVSTGADYGDGLFCEDNRVMLFDSTATRIWSYGTPRPGANTGQLNHPTHATVTKLSYGTPSTPCPAGTHYSWIGNIIITDSGNNRIVVIDWCTGQTMWEFGPASGKLRLKEPFMTEALENGNILIADTGNHRVLEINRAKQLVGEYNKSIPLPLYASRVDWTWLNDINTDSTLIGTEVITDVEDGVPIQVNTKGSGKSLFTKADILQYFEADDVDFIEVIRFRDNAHYLVSAMFEPNTEWEYFLIFSWDNHKKFVNYVVGPEFGLGFSYGATIVGDYTGLTVPPYFTSYDRQYCGNMFFVYRNSSVIHDGLFQAGNICGYCGYYNGPSCHEDN